MADLSEELSRQLDEPLMFGWRRSRAFTGGLITTSGVTLAAAGTGQSRVIVAITILICAAVKVYPPDPDRQWHSPFFTGLGLGCLIVGTLTAVRPYDTGSGWQWAAWLTAGSVAMWLLPHRRGRPAFLLTALVGTMLWVTSAKPPTGFDPSDRLPERLLESLDPSATGMVIFALGYTVIGLFLDRRALRGGAGTFFFAGAISVLWGAIAMDEQLRRPVAATLITAVILLVSARGGGRFYMRTMAVAAIAVAATKLPGTATLPVIDVDLPDVPWTLQVGVVIAVVGVFVGRGVKAE